MKIRLNGELKEMKQNLTLEDLLRLYRVNPKTVVIERNRCVVPASELGLVQICEGDQIEIVQFVGGGRPL